MKDFIAIYAAVSPLILIAAARATAISREYRRLPSVAELVVGAKFLSKENKKLIRIAAGFSIAFSVFILTGWQAGSLDADISKKSTNIFFGMTAFNSGYVSYISRSVYFNVFVCPEGGSARQENELYFSNLKLFPGFGDKVKSLITISTSLVLISLAFTLVAG